MSPRLLRWACVGALLLGGAAGFSIMHLVLESMDHQGPKDRTAPTRPGGAVVPPGSTASTGGTSVAPTVSDGSAPEPTWDNSLGAPPRFVDAAARAGLVFRHENGKTGKLLYPEIMGGGVAILDFDGDGLLDVYLVNGNRLGQPPDPTIVNRLFRNNGDGTFGDVTARARVGDPGYGQGVCAADYDSDGDTDIYVSNFGRNVLYRNIGDGTFTDVSTAAGVADPGWGQSSTFLDYDGDGWLDLYVQNYMTFRLEDQAESFIYVGGKKVLDYPSPLSYRGAADRLYRNRGDGSFVDVTEEAGLLKPEGKGMGTACVDFNGDGLVDIFVANDTMENYLFGNLGGGKFQEVGLPSGVAFDGDGAPEASMGVDVGDFDGDGRFDLIVPCLRKQVYTLYRNEGRHFTDVSVAAGLVEPTSRLTGFNANFLDYDNDGDLDLFFTNGAVRRNELAAAESSYEEAYGLPDTLLANNGKGHFTDVSSLAGPYFQEALIGRGSAVGDLDDDGDLDIVITNLAGRAVLLLNETRGGHWIAVRLRGRAPNIDALGSVVTVTAGDHKQRAAVHGGVSYLSQSDRRAHFGLSTHEAAERIEVRWPSGETQVFKDLVGNRTYTLVQGDPAPR